MLAIIGSLLGFGTSFLPKIFAYFENKQNHVQEMERMRLSAELAESQHKMDMIKINQEATIAQNQAIYSHEASFDNTSPLVDNIRALVRPVLTFGSLLIYGGLLCFADMNMLSTAAFQGLETMVATVWSFRFGQRSFKG